MAAHDLEFKINVSDDWPHQRSCGVSNMDSTLH